MPAEEPTAVPPHPCSFNEAAGADPADAYKYLPLEPDSHLRFNEAAGADPADATPETETFVQTSALLQ